jgi:hypothetical protein
MLTRRLGYRVARDPYHPVFVHAAPVQEHERQISSTGQCSVQAVVRLDFRSCRVRGILASKRCVHG